MKKANEYYKKACNIGNGSSCNLLVFNYKLGHGFKKRLQ